VAALAGRAGDGDRADHALQQRHLDRLAGRHRVRPRALRGRRAEPDPDDDERRGGREPLRGLLQRDPVAAVPRRGREAGVPPGVVGRLHRRQPPVRRAGGRSRRRGRHRVGARLPDAAGPRDAARAAAGPADRLLPAHPVPTDRALPAAAVAPADPRGPARRRPRRLPAQRRRPELRAPGPAAGRPQDPPRPGLPARRAHGEGGGVPDLDRLARPGGAGPLGAGRGARHRDPRAARQPTQGLPRRRSRRPRASRSSSTASCATTSTAWSAGSTATWAGSGHRRSATCTRRTPRRRWRRSTGPPTSWSSRRTATG
jgi:hypothetical protein